MVPVGHVFELGLQMMCIGLCGWKLGEGDVTGKGHVETNWTKRVNPVVHMSLAPENGIVLRPAQEHVTATVVRGWMARLAAWCYGLHWW